MIVQLTGTLVEVLPSHVVIDVGGVGYELGVSATTAASLPAVGEAGVTVLTRMLVKENAVELYGFSTRQERELYRLLITVSGVGANTARMILSSLSPKELCNVIANGDERVLKGVKGIGLKTAQRIIVDLRDKVISSGIAEELHAGGASAAVAVPSPVRDEAVQALSMLGFPPAPSAKVVSQILAEQPELLVEQVIKLALKMIK